MPGLNGEELSDSDLGITKTLICPQCSGTKVDSEPAYRDGEPVGSRYMCRGCGWTKSFDENSPEQAARSHDEVEEKLVRLKALQAWLDGFREIKVEQIHSTDDEEEVRRLKAQISVLGELQRFFDQR